MPPIWSEIKYISVAVPSGSPTSSGIYIGGYHAAALYIPVITSAVIAFAGDSTGGVMSLFRNTAGAQYSAATPGGTGGMWLGSDGLAFMDGFIGYLYISGAAAQTADRTFQLQLKG